MYGTLCVQIDIFKCKGSRGYICNPFYILIIKSDASTFHIVVIYFRDCVYEVPLCCHIMPVASYRSRESRDFVSIIIAQSMICANNWAHCGLDLVFACLHFTLSNHHYANLSESIELTTCLLSIFGRVYV